MQVVFLPSKDDLTPAEKKLIADTLLKHARHAAKMLGYKPEHFTFTIYPGWKRQDRESMPAFTQSPEWVWISLNIKTFRNKKSQVNMLERLKYIAYHEMHHAARGYVGLLPGKEKHTLMNCFLSEGLADHFALEQYPSDYIKKKVTYDQKEAKLWLRKFKGREWAADYKQSEVMGGNGKPTSLGYKIGRFLIDSVKKNSPKFTATKAVKTPSKKLLKMSSV